MLEILFLFFNLQASFGDTINAELCTRFAD